MKNNADLPLEKAFNLFKSVADNCSAYSQFLKKNKIKIPELKTVQDFSLLPITDRRNYLNKYPVHQRIRDNKQLSDYYLITTSSGSTGNPTLWLRDQSIDDQIIPGKIVFYEQFFDISKQRTLIVNTLALGMWIGGILETMLAIAAARTNKITIVTPGMNVHNATTAIRELYRFYDQIIIIGYPPLVTDLIEEMTEKELPFANLNLKFILTGDRFSEHWRSALKAKVNSPQSRIDIIGMYACSDTGIIGVETPLSIKILQKIQSRPALIKKYFHSQSTPSLVEYNPLSKHIEVIKDEIVITADQPIPLIRYNIHDRGGILTQHQIRELCRELGIRISKDQLPDNLLFVHGRTDSILINSANVYTEDIRHCIQNSRYASLFSQNFQYGVVNTSGMKNRLQVILYFKPHQRLKKTDQEKFEQEFFAMLKGINADYRVTQEHTRGSGINFIYRSEEANHDKYKNTKLKHFI